MNAESTTALFPIRELVRRTGVNASTLRAWENRHGLLTPARAPSGHRLYSQGDVLRIRRLQDLLAQGLSLADIAPLLAQEPIEAANDLSPPSDQDIQKAASVPPTAWHGYLLKTMRVLENFSTERLDNLYSEACALYPMDIVTHNLLIPALEHLGTRWDKRPSGIAEEHFFSAWLRNKLGARLHHAAGPSRGGHLILACLPHENHEIGLLVFALSALQRGYRIIYLGANMPIRQIVHVARGTHALGIVLSGRDVDDPNPILNDLAYLAESAGPPVFVGSHFSVNFREGLLRIGAIPLGDHMAVGMRLLESRLRSLSREQQREERPNARA